MVSDIYWIDHPGEVRLATMACPRAGDWLEAEVEHWEREGVEVVVSLLEAWEEAALGLQAEGDLCRAHGIEFISFPIVDGDVPADRDAALGLARTLVRCGKSVAIHCRAGIGRSSLVAALVLLQRGETPQSAFELIRAARGLDVPDTMGQREWISQAVR